MATDYEKKYKEALERAKRLTSDMTTLQKIREFIFPELVESEDERIRKEIYDFVKLHDGDTYEDKSEWLAWLEKQKEQNLIMANSPQLKEQKPAEWSEEDEEMLNSCISSIEESKENRYAYKETDGDTSYDREVDWLKSLRPQPKKGYSDEDEDRISDVLWCIEQSRKVAKNENDMGTCWSAERFVKSLRPQQRQEWSDEEKEILDSILSHYVLIDKPIDANGISKEKYISLIKSLRFDTYKNCNSHWKPSEEQMEALERASTNKYLSAKQFDILVSLYEQLKKLM